MLAVLAEKAGGAAPFPLAVADASRLPFRDGAFGAALASHVLHLVGDLEATLHELVRVVRDGGVLLLDLGAAGSGHMNDWWPEARDVFVQAAGIERRPDVADLQARVTAELQARGASIRPLEPIMETIRTTPEERIARLEEGVYSFTWNASEAQRHRGADGLRASALERFGSLTRPVEAVHRIEWLAYNLAL
jgi:ubiquinone/menaquinone biosynthesis C-methylase UbiE